MNEDEAAETAAAAAAVYTTTPTVSKEEMLDLVRAIKFAKPDASMREVHREITEKLSQNESFEFLKDMKLNDVKKVWKKAVAESAAKRSSGSDSKKDSISSLLPQDNQVWKLYTIGNGSVKALATEYSQATAKAIAEKTARGKAESLAEQQALMENYVHVFLDVPADLSGSRPHQALINFNENSKKGKEKKSKQEANDDDERGVIVKIQVAASPDGVKYPMLLYSQDRSMKTFIHPDEDDDDGGYDKIRTWIVSGGSDGALGAAGGTKAYFYTRVSKRKHGVDVLSIDTRELGPPQTW